MASLRCALSMFSSTFVIGMMKLTSKWLITLTIRPRAMIRHVFSKSVSCMSMVLNSTRHPIFESFEGGGLKRSEFQLVDCKFSKWHVRSESSIYSSINSPSYAGTGSRVNNLATWSAILSSISVFSFRSYLC